MTGIGAQTGSQRRGLLMLAVLLAVVAAIAVVGVVVGRDHGNASAGRDWDSLAGLDPETGEIVVYDEQGDEVDRFPSGVDDPISSVPRGRHVLVSGSGSTAVIDVAEQETVWEDTGTDDPVWLGNSAAPILLVGPLRPGELRVVDVVTGNEFDLAEVADIDDPFFIASAVRSSPDGTVVAATDLSGDGVTVIVDLDSGEAHAVAGRVVAVADDEVVVVEGSRDQIDARFYSPDGEDRGTAPLPQLISAALWTDEGTLLVVTEWDGATSAFRTSVGDDEPTEIGDLDASGVGFSQAFSEQERLVVTVDGGALVLDADGTEVATIEGEFRPTTGQVPALAACFVVVDEDTVTVHDLETGQELASTEPTPLSPLHSSADGCSVSSFEFLLTPDGARDVEDGDLWSVAPDGRAALGRRDGKNLLLDLTDADSEPTEVGRLAYWFVER